MPGCEATFASTYLMKKHKDLGHQIVQCDVCNEFMTKSELKKHMKNNHRPSIPCTEPNCGRTFVKIRLLETHIRREHRTVECDVCKKQIIAKRLKQHMEVVHLNLKMTTCDVCGKLFKSGDAYKRHYETAHTQTERVQCEICHAFVKNKIVLYTHMRNLHSGCEPVTCPICGHQSPNPKAAKLHLVFHKNKEEMQYMCSICGQRFVSKTQMIQHSDVHKSFRAKIKCTQCDKEFLHKSSLRVTRLFFPFDYEFLLFSFILLL